MGGSLASLVGLTFGAPVVAFEAPGEALAAKRLHLPLPVSRMHKLASPEDIVLMLFLALATTCNTYLPHGRCASPIHLPRVYFSYLY